MTPGRRISQWFRRFWLKAGALIISGWVLYNLVFPLRPVVGYAVQVKDRNGDLLHAFLSDDDKWRLYAELSEITPLLKRTFLRKEDKYFYYHPGINPLAVVRALAGNFSGARQRSGASTITMQVARMLERRPRTYGSKLIEMWTALRLESSYSKDEILQMYFNLIPFGGNIEGIKAASVLYFGKPPQLLSLAEITALTVIPNNPEQLNPQRKKALLTERNKWLKRFEKEGLFSVPVIRDALQEPLVAYRREAPKKAPHLSLRLRRELPAESRIVTTLRQAVQSQAEALVENYVNRIRGMGIRNAAVLVLNNETMEVEGYVGSADFENPVDGGQVDGVRAVRSPGSTLKPFVYAVAFDKGICIPKTVVNDVPSNFAGYQPENFDQKFKGPVTVEFALANSLNIPAVKVLNQLEVRTMVSQLTRAGFRTIEKQANDLGLSLVLGGCGTTLEEITRLYAVFARGGRYGPMNLTMDAGTGKSAMTLMSEEAAYMITQILSKSDRPDLPNNFDHTYRLPRIAWKTGTSYGKRDAWSIGYNRKYTIGVWVGNFSGAGVPELSGANIATPLLFELFNSIQYNSPKDWFERPDRLELRKVCSHSGAIPADGCTELVNGDAIEGISEFRRCEHLRWVFTDPDGTVSYCTYCLPAEGFEKRSYPNLAPELIAFYHKAKIPYLKIPPHNRMCQRMAEDGPPVIVSPQEGSEYYLQGDGGSEIQLLSQASHDAEYVTWFVNDRLLKKTDPVSPVFLVPPLGTVKISCVDSKGRNTDVVVFVKRF
ncbi:penicillin-binding protein 1C [Ravibacter arvi]|uniref:peptidoglycan glycosyltransferase n=1 Tax=Ravibacter arvi TaxID=2051041 RepID=A0ABP8M1U8_9BACT